MASPPPTDHRSSEQPHSRPTSSWPRLACFLATAAGGHLPLIPGTWGSLAGVVLGCGLAAISRRSLLPMSFPTGWAALNVIVAGLGVWACGETARQMNHKDPPQAVLDEVSGQLLSYAGHLAGLAALNWKSILLGFILFRVFDILKPFPARRAEWFAGGWGIMADDWVAGGYAALALWAIHRVSGL